MVTCRVAYQAGSWWRLWRLRCACGRHVLALTRPAAMRRQARHEGYDAWLAARCGSA